MSTTLTLPEPAGGLYDIVRESLARFLPTVIDDGGGWAEARSWPRSGATG